MDAVMLHIVKDMVPVYTMEKPEVHPHAGGRGRGRTHLPGQRCVK